MIDVIYHVFNVICRVCHPDKMASETVKKMSAEAATAIRFASETKASKSGIADKI